MPNWCNNFLRIEVSDRAHRKFIQNFCGKMHEPSGLYLPFSLEKIVPMPESEKDNWYEWRCKNWGTKWELHPSECFVWTTTKSIWYNFQSAWSPPLPVVERLSRHFPTNFMRIEFEEKGMAITGNVKYQAGFVLNGSRARMGKQPIQLV